MGRKFPVLVLVAALCGATTAFAADIGRGTLDEPAVESRFAVHSPIVAAAQAGHRLVVAGERGHVLYSDDAGGRWTQAKVPVSVTLTALCFADEHTGWAVGHRGVVLKTSNGAASWERVLDGMRVNELLGEAAGDDAKLLAETRRFARDGADKPFLDVVCDGPRVAAIGAFGIAVASDDGGRSWRGLPAMLDRSDLRHLNAIVRLADGFVLAGEQGGLYRASSDWGRIERLASPGQASFFGIVASRAGTLVALGLRGNLFRSGDAGASWTRIDVDSTLTLTAGIALDDGSLMLVDEAGGVWRSVDDGRSFERTSVPGAFPFAGMVQADDGRVLAVGARGLKWLEPVAAARP